MTSQQTIGQALARAPLPPRAALGELTRALGALVVVDLETTGLDPTSARIIEVGAVKLVPGEEPEVFQALVDPGVALEPGIEHLTGISGSDLVGEGSWEEVAPAFARFAAVPTLIAHNAAFERAMLARLLVHTERYLDTLELACVLRPELPSHSLATLARLLLGRDERHRALDDALDTLAVLSALQGEVLAGEHAPLAGLLASGARRWPWSGLLVPDEGVARLPSWPVDRAERLAAGQGAGVVALAERPWVAWQSPAPPAIPRDWYSPEFLRSCLGDERRWQRVIPGYLCRDGQVELAVDILRAFQTERAFAAEAGTGIGKTLAYCLVATLHALATGERVVISSANKTLQGRIVEEELPRVAAGLGIPGPRAIVLKGRANYGNPARARAIAARPADFGFEALSAAARLYLTTFFARCPGQDLESLGGWLLFQDPSLRAVRERIACHAQCSERACRSEAPTCAYLQRLDHLDTAHVVSINHALLLKWPERYGPIERLIIDEAHELAGEGDRAFCEEIGSRELRSLLGQIAGGGGGGLALALGNRAGDPALARRAADLAARVERMLPAIGDALFAAAPSGSTVVPGGDTEALPEAWRAPARLLGGLAAELATLGEMLDHLNGTHRAALFAEQGRAGDPLSASAAAVALSLASAARGLIADAFVQSRTATVYAAQAFDRRDAGHEWRLSATPLEVADLIHARLLEPARTVVAVSATLGISGDPRPSLEKIGWQRVPAVRRLPPRVIPSPFDFPHQSVLAFVRGQQYRQPGFAARCATAIVEIARLLGGRTMALFTSRQRLGDVVARIAEPLAADGIAVLAQERPGGAARLVEQFNADPRCVLLGLRSLWQGVDIPGEALSCVVIEKLPFPRPDPLLLGRSQRIKEAGGDDFRVLSLEPAVVAFKQMFGRLIRNESDRGFVVVLGADTAMRYLPEFVASLPGPPRLVVGELEEILIEMRAFFAPRAP